MNLTKFITLTILSMTLVVLPVHAKSKSIEEK